jgi:serine/threonine protein kinase
MEKIVVIPDRLNLIENMLDGKIMDSIIDYDEKDFKNISSKDIRDTMNKKYIDFTKAIEQLGGKLLYIKSGSTGHTFKGVYPNMEKKPNYGVKIVAYPKKEKYGDMFDPSRPENAELLMIKLLSKFVKKGQTPHVVLPITTFNTSIKPFLSLKKDDIVNNKKYDDFLKKYKKGYYYKNVSVLISEWANGGDLLDYIRKNFKSFTLKTWRMIFFQVLSVLAVIQNKYPGFRHNDMKANNILVQLIPISKKKNKFMYKINKQNYIVPNIGFQLKLWDFDFACIPDLINNSKVSAEWTTAININPEQNRYYDIHYFINTLTRKGFFNEFWTHESVPNKIREFVKRIVPKKFRKGDNVSERGRILSKEEFTTPDKILKEDPLFEVMRYN